MASAILLSVGGVTVIYLAMASRYREAAPHLNAAIAQTAALDAAVNDHEIQLRAGTPDPASLISEADFGQAGRHRAFADVRCHDRCNLGIG